jgi:general secretion pathway protein H
MKTRTSSAGDSPGPDAERRRGFTLVELLVVLLIVSLVVGLVPPLFSGAVPGAQLKAAARDLAVALRLARNQSITGNVETQVHLNLESPAYAIGNQPPRTLPAGVELKVASASGQNIEAKRHLVRFFADGSSSGARITLSKGKRGYRLHLGWLTGRISIEDVEADVR